MTRREQTSGQVRTDQARAPRDQHTTFLHTVPRSPFLPTT